MKFQQLRKRLLMETAIVAAALSIVGGITYYTMGMQEEYNAKKNTLEGQVSAVTNETNGLREKFIRVQKDKDLYQLVMTLNETDMLSHSTVIVDAKFREYENTYNLNTWSLDSSATVAPLDDALYKRKTSVIASRDAVLTFDGVSDEDVYNMMQAMQRDFPGAVSFTGLTLVRDSRLTDEGLRSITKTGSFPLIKGDIKFLWFGINSLDPEEAKKQAVTRTRRRR